MDIFEIVRENNLDRLKDNLKYFNINVKDSNSFSLLHYAVINNNLDIVNYLIINGIDINCLNDDLNSPLHLSVIYNNIGIFKRLIKSGAKIDLINKNLETPLMLAAKFNRIDMANILLSLNAKTNLIDVHGNNLLFLSLHQSNIDFISNLIEKDTKLLYTVNNNLDTIIHICCKNNNVKALEYILDKYDLTNLYNKDLETPIMISARNNNIEAIRILLKKKTIIEITNRFNESIFDICDNRTKDYLTFKQNEVEYLNFKNNYPLIYAVLKRDDELFNRHLNKIEINKKDNYNLSALDYALKYNYQNYIFKIKLYK